MDEKTQKTSSAKSVSEMDYSERLAHYEWEKMDLPRIAKDQKTYEAALRALAKKWRI